MEDIIVYYYLVRQVDYLKQTKEYHKLYDDVLKYLPILPAYLGEYTIKHIMNFTKGFSKNKYLNDLRKFCKDYKFTMVNP